MYWAILILILYQSQSCINTRPRLEKKILEKKSELKECFPDGALDPWSWLLSYQRSICMMEWYLQDDDDVNENGNDENPNDENKKDNID